MQNNNIRISVCLASYNGEKYLAEQLSSILSQLSLEDELIISDDSSTDSTPDIIQKFCSEDRRIRFITVNSFRSPVANFQNALQAARGKYIFLADQDDVWLEGKVVRMLDLLKENLLVVHDAIVTDEHKKVLSPSYFAFRQAKRGFWHNFYKNGYTGCCMAFRHELLKRALPFPPGLAMHDQWLGLLAEGLGRICFIYEPYLLFRRHGQNFSPGMEKRNSILKKNQLRLTLLKLLIIRIYKTRSLN